MWGTYLPLPLPFPFLFLVSAVRVVEAGVIWDWGTDREGGCSDYVHGAVASVDTAECVKYAAAACVVGGWDMGEGEVGQGGKEGFRMEGGWVCWEGMYKLAMYGMGGEAQSIWVLGFLRTGWVASGHIMGMLKGQMRL
jgi:hypothetical protein